MNRVLRVVCPFAVSLFVSATAFGQAADPGVEKLRTDYEQAWKKGDAKAVAALYTEDTLAVNQFGIVIRGRAAIEKANAENFGGPFKGSTIAITLGAQQMLGADMAIGEGTYTISGATGPDGKPMSIKGRYLNTLKKQGDAWLIAGNAAFIPERPPAGSKPALKSE